MLLQDFREIWCPLIWIFLPVSSNSKTISTEVYPINGSTESSLFTPYPDGRSYDNLRQDYDDNIAISQGRGMDDMDHMSGGKVIKNDPWQGYIDFLINEGSYKFWSVFQVVTCAILIYSAFAAVYYAKYNFIQADYDDYDFFRADARSSRTSRDLWSGLSAQTFQRILDAISSKKYS